MKWEGEGMEKRKIETRDGSVQRMKVARGNEGKRLSGDRNMIR